MSGPRHWLSHLLWVSNWFEKHAQAIGEGHFAWRTTEVGAGGGGKGGEEISKSRLSGLRSSENRYLCQGLILELGLKSRPVKVPRQISCLGSWLYLLVKDSYLSVGPEFALSHCSHCHLPLVRKNIPKLYYWVLYGRTSFTLSARISV